MMKNVYFTFPTTYQAIRAEKVLAKKNCKYKMVPVPRSISSSCGVALSCLPPDAPTIKGYLTENSVIVEGVFELPVPAGRQAYAKRKN